MSEATSPAPPQPRRRRWWRWLVPLPLLLVGAAFGYYFYARQAADRELTEALAETDRLDPDWRFEEIEQKRRTYPPEENAAETVLAAYGLLPRNWPSPPPAAPPGGAAPEDADASTTPAGQTASLDDRVSGVPPEVQLDAALLRDLRAELARDGVKDALAVTERLSRQAGGRYNVAWGTNPLSANLPYQDARPVAALLRMQALLQDQDGQADDALATARRIIVVGRSLGDEPAIIAQLVRVALHALAVQAVERALAQGLPSAEALARTQRLLQEDAAEPLLLYAFRGERALQHRLIDWLQSADPAVVGGSPSSWRQRAERHLYMAHKLRRYHAVMLRTFGRAVEIARLQPEEQAEELRRLEEETDHQAGGARGREELVSLLMPALGKVGAAFRRDRALLRGAVVGLALERYRLEKGTWPKNLKQLVPDYLPAVPLDPFDGREMRYLPLPVGPDGHDDGGALNRKNIVEPGTDLGFRLWDVTARRQPAAEALPPPDESTP